ncbi:MAG: glycosyltransferase [Ignavibacteriales bacterium]|nr:glycosyltransferase [Ignavibacteriales bacterium]
MKITGENNKILESIDKDILDQGIVQAVLDDGGNFKKDKNLLPIFNLLSERNITKQPYWELRCIIRWIARRLRANKYLEIGVRTGWSLVQAVSECPNIMVTGFDLWLENYADISNSNPTEVRKLLQEIGHKGNTFLISGDSHITLPAFLFGSQSTQSRTVGAFDIVTVDGDHSRDGAMQDLEICAPLVKPGGAIVFDDLIHEDHEYLLDVWKTFAKAHPEFLCIENIRDYPGTGIGFRLPFNSNIAKIIGGKSEKYYTFTPHDSVLTTQIQAIEQIGYRQNIIKQQHVVDEIAFNRISSELNAIQSDRLAKQAVVDHLVKELDGVRSDRADKQEIVDRLVKELDGVRSDRAAKQEIVDRLAKELEEIRSDRAAKQEVVDRLVKELDGIRSGLVVKQETVDRLVKELDGVRSDRSAKQEIVDRLVKELDGVQSDRSAKQDVIDRLIKELDTIRSDRAAKQEVVDRLLRELNEVRADNLIKKVLVEKLRGLIQAKNSAINQLGKELAEYRKLGWGLINSIMRIRQSLRKLFDPAKNIEVSQNREPQSTQKKVSDSGGIHVALDVVQIEFGISGGVEIYMKTLVHALMSHTDDVRISLILNTKQLPQLENLFGKRVNYHVLDRIPTVSFGLKVKKAFFSKTEAIDYRSTNLTFANLREKLGVDIVHSPVQIFSQIDFTVPGILNLHDLQHLHHPENFTAGDLEARYNLYGQSATLASAIIASSDFVRNDIIQKMGIPEWKVYKIQPACNPEVAKGLESFTPQMARDIYHLPEKFGFYPAQFWIHKNHARLAEALAIVRSRVPKHDFKIVFSGYRGLTGWPNLEKVLDQYNLRDHIMFLDYIPTEHLGAIYKSATYCVVPSLFEASSYPVIEAQTLGCPAMCSNIESLTELMVDGAGLVFDPISVEDIADKMVSWLEYPEQRNMCAERGRERALRDNSLKQYAIKVFDLYRSVKETN